MKYVSDTVGVRELRQNLSVYLRCVRAGATLKVTEHRRTVAVPAPAGSGVVRSSGRSTPCISRAPCLLVPTSRVS
jgi:antitoxin (DNA-binding transcriptional repressor) of toxin-antitoxin stability system